MRCVVALVVLLLSHSTLASDFPLPKPLPDGSLEGVPVGGEMGIVRSVADIQALQAYRDRNQLPRAPRRSREHELKRFPASPIDDWLVSQWPPAEPGRTADMRAPQTVGPPNFTAAVLSETGAFPPDTMGAVGPTQFIAALNGRIRSFNKSTGAADNALNVDSDVFFSTVLSTQANTFTTDPRIRFDRITNRWFILMIDVPAGTGAIANRTMLAVSSGATITGTSNFTFFQFQQSASLFADYPTLGIDANALYVGSNMFSLTTSQFDSTAAAVIRKSSVLGSGPIVVTRFPSLATSSTSGPFTPQGVDNVDPTASTGYFIGVDTLSFSQLQLRRVTNPGATPTLSANVPIGVPATQFPVSVVAQGSSIPVDALDDRLYAAHLRDGQLWTAHNISVNSSGVAVAPTTAGARTATRWYQIGNLNASSPSLTQSGTIFDNASSNPQAFWIPSVMVSGQGHAAFGFSAASAATRIDAATTGRLASDTLGTTRAPVVRYTSSSATYAPPSDTGNPRRWGDYSYTSVDPCDDMTMWTIQQFTNAANSYGVQAVRLQAPAPTLGNCASATSVSPGATNVNVNLNGSGLFDTDSTAGACRTRLSATAGAGITVNSITVNSPTSATLNLSVAANAASGTRSISITNPDGQSASVGTCLTVSGPTVVSLNPSSTNPTCTNTSIDWALQLSSQTTGLAVSNFQLTGTSSGTINAVTGSGATRSINVTTGNSVGSLTLNLANGTGTSPAVAGLPFAGGNYTVNGRPSVLPASPAPVCSGGTTAIGLSSSPTGATFNWTLGSVVGVSGASAGSGSTIAQLLTGAGTVQYLVAATRMGCTSSATTTITQAVSNPSIATTSVPRAVVGAPYPSTSLIATGLAGGATFDVPGGNLPTGLQLSATGVLSGTPIQIGTSNVNIRVTDQGAPSCNGTRSFAFEVVAQELFANGFE